MVGGGGGWRGGVEVVGGGRGGGWRGDVEGSTVDHMLSTT